MATKNINSWPFTDAEDETIITYYEQHTSLWKLSDPNYKMTKQRPIVFNYRLLPSVIVDILLLPVPSFPSISFFFVC